MRWMIALLLLGGCGDDQIASLCSTDARADGIVEAPTEAEIKQACGDRVWMCSEHVFDPVGVRCEYCGCMDGLYGVWSCERNGLTCGQVVKRSTDRVWIREFDSCF